MEDEKIESWRLQGYENAKYQKEKIPESTGHAPIRNIMNEDGSVEPQIYVDAYNQGASQFYHDLRKK